MTTRDETNGWRPSDTAGFIHRQFEQCARLRPDAVALAFHDERLTYAELSERSSALAARLIQMGVRPETIVAISTRRTPDLIVAILGVLKSGGAYLPVDIDTPQARFAAMLQDANVVAIVVDNDASVKVGQTSLPRVNLDRDWATIATAPPVATTRSSPTSRR